MPHTEGKVVGGGGGSPPSFLYVIFLSFFLAMQMPFWNTSYKKGMNNLEKKNPLSPAVTCLLVYNRIEHNIVE